MHCLHFIPSGAYYFSELPYAVMVSFIWQGCDIEVSTEIQVFFKIRLHFVVKKLQNQIIFGQDRHTHLSHFHCHKLQYLYIYIYFPLQISELSIFNANLSKKKTENTLGFPPGKKEVYFIICCPLKIRSLEKERKNWAPGTKKEKFGWQEF